MYNTLLTTLKMNRLYQSGLSFESVLFYLSPKDRTPAKEGIQIKSQNSNTIGINDLFTKQRIFKNNKTKKTNHKLRIKS